MRSWGSASLESRFCVQLRAAALGVLVRGGHGHTCAHSATRVKGIRLGLTPCKERCTRALGAKKSDVRAEKARKPSLSGATKRLDGRTYGYGNSSKRLRELGEFRHNLRGFFSSTPRGSVPINV